MIAKRSEVEERVQEKTAAELVTPVQAERID
jgi:hypothetical protein